MAKKKQTKKAAAQDPVQQNEDIIDAGRAETEIFVPDPEVAEEFVEAQQLAGSGGQQVISDVRELNPDVQVLSGGDIDAAWDDGDSGEEAVGGSAPTPDQDDVDEIGKALGIQYDDNEPLRGAEKVSDRDTNRWELDPASSEDFRKRSNNEGEYEGD